MMEAIEEGTLAGPRRVGLPAVVAIDGVAGVGKTAVAKALAERLGWRHLDTGAMYRYITWRVREAGLDPADTEAVAELARGVHFAWRADGGLDADGVELPGEIRSQEVTRLVAAVADNQRVRSHLVREQRRLGEESPCVIEGRDIATVVFTDSPFKFFLDADPSERASRRLGQLHRQGHEAEFDRVLADVMERDARDRARPVGGMRPADDAVHLDTTSMGKQQVVEWLARRVLSPEAP
ncbi:MAG: (d)CMP kinase [Candidatus Sumerlaeia bacterium]|nr:(d)CMP kinase [Candidatus Sumerlaeia bacterium]